MWAGEMDQILETLERLRSARCRILLVTSTENNTAAAQSDMVIAYHITIQRQERSVDYTSQAPALLIVENLAGRVQRRLVEQ